MSGMLRGRESADSPAWTGSSVSRLRLRFARTAHDQEQTPMGGIRPQVDEYARLPGRGVRVLLRGLAAACALLTALHAGIAPAVVVDGAAPPTVTSVNATSSYTVSAHTEVRNENITTTLFTFPANTDLSGVTAATVSGRDVTNDANIPILGVVVNSAARTVTITTDYRRSQSRTDFTFTVGGVRNASHPGAYSYSVQITTSRNTGTRTGAYTLAANTSAVTVGAVTLSKNTSGAAAAYTVPFTVGAAGRLAGTTAAGGNTVAVTFPTAYTLPASAPASSVKVNGVASAAVVIAGKTVTITLPAALTVVNGGAVTLVFDTAFGLVNPAAGSYTLSVRTSAETGAGTSSPFTIGPSAYLTVSIDPTSVDFGVIYPGTPTAPVSLNLTVDCDAAYVVTRSLSGDVAAMGLSVTGDANGAKPGGTVAVHTDTCQANMPWSTDPDAPLSAAILYTVVRS